MSHHITTYHIIISHHIISSYGVTSHLISSYLISSLSFSLSHCLSLSLSISFSLLLFFSHTLSHFIISLSHTYVDFIGMAGSIDCKSYQFLDARDRDGGRKSLLRGLAKVNNGARMQRLDMLRHDKIG